jgi:two-component system nitrate/nitrite response regulator NarL
MELPSTARELPRGPLRVLIVAEDPLARAGLAAALASEPDIVVVGRLGPSDDLISQATTFDADAVLFDLGWEGGRDAPALDALNDLADAGAVVVVMVAEAVQARGPWLIGANAILSRESPAPTLAAGLRAASAGLVVVTPELSDVLSLRSREAEPLIEDLTPRELEVLGLVADGLTNRAIAQRLGISENTVKFHLNAILGKLGAQSRTDAIVRATRLGIIAL